MADRVHRVTLFKVPRPEDQQQLTERYKTLASTNTKDGKPYILSLAVGPAADDARARGFTVVCETQFASLDDMAYYDSACEAHGALKAFAKTLTVEDIMTVYFTPRVTGGVSPRGG